MKTTRRLRVFANRVLRRIFGAKRDEVTGEWRKLHKEELNGLYSLPNIVRVIKSRRKRWAGHVACVVEGRGVYRVLVGKPEGKRRLGRPRRRWEDNVRMDLKEMGGACSTYGGRERCVQGFGGEPEGRRLLGRPRFRWEDNIRMDLQ
jgi:hypothetical protein